jgi:hypothetical protein
MGVKLGLSTWEDDIRMDFKDTGVRMLTGFMWLSIGSHGRFL